MNKKGLTMLELLVVLVIIAIGAAIAVPSLISVKKRMEFNSDVRGALQKVNKVKSEAIKQNQTAFIGPADFALSDGAGVSSLFNGGTVGFTGRGLAVLSNNNPVTSPNNFFEFTRDNHCKRVCVYMTGLTKIEECP